MHDLDLLGSSPCIPIFNAPLILQLAKKKTHRKMGLSWSNTRRRTATCYHPPPPPPPCYYHHHAEPISLPPPPPPPPCYYHHHTEPICLPPPLPPPPPPPPPPHQSHYTTLHQPPPSQSYPPLNNPYPTRTPPQVHHYCNSHHYHSCNYANHQPFYYTCHHQPTNGWSPVIRPQVGFASAISTATAQPILPEPAPFVDHQNAKRVRNDVNVHKDTLKVEIDVSNPDHHLVSFVFDALFDGRVRRQILWVAGARYELYEIYGIGSLAFILIFPDLFQESIYIVTIFYFAKEEQDGKFIPAFPEAHLPEKISFQKGLGQKFRQPSGTGIDLGFFELDDLSKSSPEEDVFPLVIAAETFLPVDLTNENDDSVPNTLRHMQITQAVLEKKNGDNFHVRVIRQILWVAGVRYELREIYGIGSSATEGFDDSDPGKECVICMTEPKDTAVLPCRHMCMCGECAKELRLQSNKCPICRQPIEQLIGIKIKSGDQ
ncbi:hypothetical protein SADUNF_Sadunf08G0172000 [Salix dunnii]|uniref:RING-type E3 ubiquitin transferase n=1 Tax=Salix dunnii TaxID=1413687 RepID=A0A835JYR3_9ROSI|nr:hypothetical protein SADUNF_Sadunf08G0172000 [Salix dunnii]